MKKTMTRRRLMELTAALAASSAVAHNVQAQAYPNRTIRLIAPFPAGGGTDSAARIIAARLSELLGQQVVVDNRPGAGSNIGAEAAARSAPDGYTLLLGAPALAINRFLYASVNYDSVTDLAPVSLLCRYPNILAVSVSSPLTSVRSFIDYARANPGKVTYSSPGIGTTPHLSGELLKTMAGIAGFDVSAWYAPFVPAKSPPEIIARLNAATVMALSEPAVRARFEPLGVVVESSTPEGLEALLQSEIDKWGPIIKAAGISASN